MKKLIYHKIIIIVLILTMIGLGIVVLGLNERVNELKRNTKQKDYPIYDVPIKPEFYSFKEQWNKHLKYSIKKAHEEEFGNAQERLINILVELQLTKDLSPYSNGIHLWRHAVNKRNKTYISGIEIHMDMYLLNEFKKATERYKRKKFKRFKKFYHIYETNLNKKIYDMVTNKNE